MKSLLEKLQDKDNSIKLNRINSTNVISNLKADINRLEKLIYSIAEELNNK